MGECGQRFEGLDRAAAIHVINGRHINAQPLFKECLMLQLSQQFFVVSAIAGLWFASEPIFGQSRDAVVAPLLNAHAHNDYEHHRPLLDALEQGFTSVEADVYAIDGQLLVAHHFVYLKPERTLEKMYLQPLQQLAKQNGGRIYKDGPSITLLVDIKADGKVAYAALEQLLEKYDDIISVTRNGEYVERAVTVIISGDRPIAEIQASKVRRAGIDGRVSDLDSEMSSDLLPLISDKWSSHFKYRGDGPMLETERNKLRNMVKRAHDQGRRVRFWATPESPEMWLELKNANVDLIGTDELIKLATFLRATPEL